MGIEIGNASGVVPLNVGSMDLESALMAVQTNRANALEAGLKDQIGMVQKKNEKIAGLNDLLSAMNVAQAKVDAQAKAGDATNISAEDMSAIISAANPGANEKIAKLNMALGQLNALAAMWNPSDTATKKLGNETNDKNLAVDRARVACTSAGLDYGYKNIFPGDGSTTKGQVDSAIQNVKSLIGPQPDSIIGPLPDISTKGKLDGFITSLKSTIDGLSNTQQMDMLRLQSMSNKRNEAFEIMTNFIKKQADNRSSIVGNMR
jgi:hypothetical protein